MEIWTALAIGFLGSFHCIGMCGPIALALPGSEGSLLSLISGRVLYNLGRILTYSLLGAILGFIGHSIALAGLQKLLSVLLGVSIIATVIFRSSYLKRIKKITGVNVLFRQLKGVISSQFNKRGTGTLFTIGILNGLLPCGFVYVGLAGSITTGSLIKGAIYMSLFGLGTLPVMLTMSLAPSFISLGLRQQINRYIPVLAILLGLFLVYRGLFMNLAL